MTCDASYQPISRLRARMIEDMTVRGFNEQTRQHYVRHVRSFAATEEDVRRCALHQRQSGTQPSSMNTAVSAGAISPRATAIRTADSACRKSSAARNDARSIPRRAAGSMEASGGGNSRAASGGGNSRAASGRNRCGLRSSRSDSAGALSGRATRSGTRRLGLGMPRGRPRGLPELPVAKRPRASRARGKGIRTKLLIFYDSVSGKQQITGRRRWIGNDFRHRQGPVEAARARERACRFMVRSHQGRYRRPAVNSQGGSRLVGNPKALRRDRDYTQDRAGIRAPVLLVHGQYDRMVPPPQPSPPRA
jgi:hypothetical protein